MKKLGKKRKEKKKKRKKKKKKTKQNGGKNRQVNEWRERRLFPVCINIWTRHEFNFLTQTGISRQNQYFIITRSVWLTSFIMFASDGLYYWSPPKGRKISMESEKKNADM